MNKSTFLNKGVFKVSDSGRKMFCPFCNSQLNNVGGRSLYTSISKVDNRPEYVNTYCCSNKECEAFEKGAFWDESGSIYNWINFKRESSAINSFARRISIEIYKKDENFSLLNLYFFKITVVYKYKADDYGKILKRTPTFRMWTKCKHGYQSYTSGIHMFFFCVKQFKEKIVKLKNHPTDEYVIKEIMRHFEIDYDKRWWKVLFKKYINTKYKKLYLRLSNAL
jgi:hypothetical protein